MKLPRTLATLAVTISVLLWAGCGDTFRPVVNPVLPPSPIPQTASYGLVLSQNPSGVGAAGEIDISGDTNLWNQTVGATPVHAAIAGLEAFVANQGSDTVTAFPVGATAPTVNFLSLGPASLGPYQPTFVLPVSTSTTATTGPIAAAVVDTANEGSNYRVGDLLTVVQSGGSGGVVDVLTVGTDGGGEVTSVEVVSLGSGYSVANGLATTGGSGTGAQINITAIGGISKVFVANFGNNSVSLIDPTLFPPAVVGSPISVTGGTGPMGLAASTDGAQLFVVNRDSNNVSVISTATNTVTSTIAVGSKPVAAVSNSVTGLVYVLNAGDGTISIIDPSSDSVTGTVSFSAPLPASSPCLATPPGAGCAPMVFDPKNVRLYVADGTTVTISDANSNTLAQPKSISGFFSPTMVAPLADGTRAYVLNTNTSDGSCGPVGAYVVSVLSATNNQVSKCVELSTALGATPVSIAASANSSRVLVAHKAGTDTNGNVTLQAGTTDIATASDAVVTDLPAPPVNPSDPNCEALNPVCTRMVPAFVVTTH